MKPAEYQLTDEQIAKAFVNTNFGTANLREELAQGVLSRIAGYTCGNTLSRILMDLGFVTKKNNPTKKGCRFCCHHFYHYAYRKEA